VAAKSAQLVAIPAIHARRLELADLTTESCQLGSGMNPVPEKWRVAFTPTPQLGSVASARLAVAPDLEVWRDNDGHVCAYGYIADGYGWMDLLGTGKFRFDPRNREVTAFALPGVSPDLVRDSYSHAALPMALHFFGCEVLHASAVRTIRGVVAFCAVSETGKSTIASAFALRGYPLWADDAVAIDSSGTASAAAILTLRLPFSLRLRHASAQYLGKRDYDASRGELDHEFATSPLAAICVLKRSSDLDRDVEIRRLSPVEAFGALLPHAFCFSLCDRERKRAMLKLYLRAAAETPVFAIAFTPGFERLPGILDGIEDTVGAFAPPSSSINDAGVYEPGTR
jgi:hypothetical protein